MRGNSAPVQSRQHECHADLEKVVVRHLQHPWRAPPHAPSVIAFERWISRVGPGKQPLILDSGCGTGASTRILAARYPDALVLGVDQSFSRLGDQAEFGLPIGDSAWLLRARAETVWLGLQQLGIRVASHFLLYPNPWPKPEHLRRRWHGHPAWPVLLAISDQLEVRSNWPVYVSEFASALTLSGYQSDADHAFAPDSALTPFEAKYLASGHVLSRLTARLR